MPSTKNSDAFGNSYCFPNWETLRNSTDYFSSPLFLYPEDVNNCIQNSNAQTCRKFDLLETLFFRLKASALCIRVKSHSDALP